VFGSEFDEWWKRTRRLFEEIDRLIDEMMRDFERGVYEAPERRGKRRIVGPYFYGFSVTIGPDGVPRIQEWGNIRPGIGRIRVSESIEPFTDVIEEEDVIKIIMDLPGVEKEDIDIEISEEELRVQAERGDRKYYKVVKLPAKVKPDTAKAQYKNGVLTITVEKLEKKRRPSGYKVKVE